MGEKDGKKHGGLGKLVFVVIVLLGTGGGAFWFLAPERLGAQLQWLGSLLGG